jgi:hypothetical protein
VSVLVSKMLPMRLEAGGRTFKINCETKGVKRGLKPSGSSSLSWILELFVLCLLLLQMRSQRPIIHVHNSDVQVVGGCSARVRRHKISLCLSRIILPIDRS